MLGTAGGDAGTARAQLAEFLGAPQNDAYFDDGVVGGDEEEREEAGAGYRPGSISEDAFARGIARQSCGTICEREARSLISAFGGVDNFVAVTAAGRGGAAAAAAGVPAEEAVRALARALGGMAMGDSDVAATAAAKRASRPRSPAETCPPPPPPSPPRQQPRQARKWSPAELELASEPAAFLAAALGVSEGRALAALEAAGGDEDDALEMLLMEMKVKEREAEEAAYGLPPPRCPGQGPPTAAAALVEPRRRPSEDSESGGDDDDDDDVRGNAHRRLRRAAKAKAKARAATDAKAAAARAAAAAKAAAESGRGVCPNLLAGSPGAAHPPPVATTIASSRPADAAPASPASSAPAPAPPRSDAERFLLDLFGGELPEEVIFGELRRFEGDVDRAATSLFDHGPSLKLAHRLEKEKEAEERAAQERAAAAEAKGQKAQAKKQKAAAKKKKPPAVRSSSSSVATASSFSTHENGCLLGEEAEVPRESEAEESASEESAGEDPRQQRFRAPAEGATARDLALRLGVTEAAAQFALEVVEDGDPVAAEALLRSTVLHPERKGRARASAADAGAQSPRPASSSSSAAFDRERSPELDLGGGWQTVTKDEAALRAAAAARAEERERREAAAALRARLDSAAAARAAAAEEKKRAKKGKAPVATAAAAPGSSSSSSASSSAPLVDPAIAWVSRAAAAGPLAPASPARKARPGAAAATSASTAPAPPAPAAAAAAARARARAPPSPDSDSDGVDLPTSAAPSDAGGFHRDAAPVRFREQHARGDMLFSEFLGVLDAARAARAAGDAELGSRLLARSRALKERYDRERKEAAARIAAERNRLHTSTRSFDLHGQTVPDALDFVASHLRHELEVPELIARTCGPVSLRFMVGKGNHSRGGVSRLRGPVAGLILETGFSKEREVRWEPHFATVTVTVESLAPERRRELLDNLGPAFELVKAKYCGRGGSDGNNGR